MMKDVFGTIAGIIAIVLIAIWNLLVAVFALVLTVGFWLTIALIGYWMFTGIPVDESFRMILHNVGLM